MNSGPAHIQSIYSSAYLDFNIQLYVTALLLEISRQFYAPYTANFEPNTAHILPFTLCELWSRLYTKYLQLRIFRLQYSAVGICAAIVYITTIQCALYCKLVAKYSAYPPVFIMWTVVTDIYNVIRVTCIQSSIFTWTYLRCYWRYLDKSMCVIVQAWCQIQRTFSSLRYLNCGLGHIQCTYSSIYSGFNIQLNTSALPLRICRQFNAPYTANMVPNMEQILQFTLSELRSRTYTM
jgi:hypothetical protein